jgi:hypothetical protein
MQPVIVTSHRLTVRYILGVLFVFFSTLPWVSFGTNKLETQPWFMILGLLFVVSVAKFPVRRNVCFIILIPVALVLTMILSGFYVDFLEARAIVSYMAFVLVLFGFYVYVMRYGFPWKIIIFSNIIWLFVAVLQIRYGKMIFDFLVSARTSETRGVTSLAAEPTYFGFFLLFISWMYLIAGNYKLPLRIWLLVILNSVFMVFFSRSSTAVLFLVVGICFFIIRSFSVRSSVGLVLALVISLLSVHYAVQLMPGTRLFSLYKKVFSIRVIELAYIDDSINGRLADVIFPIHGFFINYGLPGGFHSYGLMRSELISVYGGYFRSGRSGSEDNKIMSFSGAFLYELGLFAAAFFVGLFLMLWDGTKKRFTELAFFFIILLNSFSVAFPLVAMIISMWFYIKNSARSITS